jgi:small subunit ribosomal protein S17
MAKKKEEIVLKEKKKEIKVLTRGRSFEGVVIRRFNDRVVIEFKKLLYLRKYESYEKRRTRLHARLPPELRDQINIGDYIEISECRPLSKIIHFIVTKKIRSVKDESSKQ